jgi:hypothetical protein
MRRRAGIDPASLRTLSDGQGTLKAVVSTPATSCDYIQNGGPGDTGRCSCVPVCADPRVGDTRECLRRSVRRVGVDGTSAAGQECRVAGGRPVIPRVCVRWWPGGTPRVRREGSRPQIVHVPGVDGRGRHDDRVSGGRPGCPEPHRELQCRARLRSRRGVRRPLSTHSPS